MIKYYVDDSAAGLRTNTCPFCIHYCRRLLQGEQKIHCSFCPYGKLHGICNDSGSDYRKIVRSKGFSHDLFTNEFYRELIRDIENY